MIIATHNGTFHADETVACAVITALFENSQIIRSRDPLVLEKADLIIDVSGINDDRHYDHHDKNFNLSRPNGVKYATAGLMWKKFGIKYLQKAALSLSFVPDVKVLERAFLNIDEKIMTMVDLNDNGQLTEYTDRLCEVSNEKEQAIKDALCDFFQQTPDLPYLVAMQNQHNQSGEDQDKAFLSTVKILRTLLLNCAINALYTEYGIAKVLAVYQGGPILIMHERLPWSQAVLSHPKIFDECLLAVYPDRENRWRVQSLPVSRAQIFKNKLSAPKEWRGLNFEDLDKVTGLKNTTFIHKSGFTGGAGTFEDNLELAKLWIKLGTQSL